MKDLIIIGAGGMGREIVWLVDDINQKEPTWNILGFVDDTDELQGTMIEDEFPMLGKINDLEKYNTENTWVICAIGSPRARKAVMERVMQQFTNLQIATLIHPLARVRKTTKVGRGCILADYALISADIELGEFVFLNSLVGVGHDATIRAYTSVMTSSNISGNVHIGECCDFGTGSKVIPGINICDNVVIGAGAVVVKDIAEPGTYAGVPAKKIK